MTDTSASMTAERLADSIGCAKLYAKYERGPDGDHDLASTLDDLLAHIDAQAARIAELERRLALTPSALSLDIESLVRSCDDLERLADQTADLLTALRAELATMIDKDDFNEATSEMARYRTLWLEAEKKMAAAAPSHSPR